MTHHITHHELANGLNLVVEPMEGVQSAAFTFLVPAGAIYDPDPLEGISTILCDMLMRGAGARDSRQLITDLDNLGVERAQGVSSSHLSFSGATLADNLHEVLHISSDIVRRPRLPAGMLEAARQLALQELAALDDDPRQKVMVELRQRHYPPPWGRSTLGTVEGLTAITHPDVTEQFKRLFRPNGTILGIAGQVDVPTLITLVEDLFGDWEPDPLPTVTEGPCGPRFDHVAQETAQIQIGVAYDSVPYGHDDFYDAWAAVAVLSGGMGARLFTEVREKRGLCYAVHASHHTLRHRASVMCYAGTTTDRAQQTLEVLLAEIQRLPQGIAPEELERVKARMKSSLIMQQESSAARAAAVARDWYFLGRVCTLDEVHDEIERLTCQSVQEHLQRYPPRNFTTLTLGPSPLEVPPDLP